METQRKDVRTWYIAEDYWWWWWRRWWPQPGETDRPQWCYGSPQSAGSSSFIDEVQKREDQHVPVKSLPWMPASASIAAATAVQTGASSVITAVSVSRRWHRYTAPIVEFDIPLANGKATRKRTRPIRFLHWLPILMQGGGHGLANGLRAGLSQRVRHSSVISNKVEGKNMAVWENPQKFACSETLPSRTSDRPAARRWALHRLSGAVVTV